MKEDRIRILKMVEDGKITAEEAAKLMEALNDAGDEDAAGGGVPVSGKKRRKVLKLRVFDGNLEKPKVNLTLPFGLVKILSKVLPKDAKAQLQEQNIDLASVISAVDEVSVGKILEVNDEEDRVRVEIVVE